MPVFLAQICLYLIQYFIFNYIIFLISDDVNLATVDNNYVLDFMFMKKCLEISQLLPRRPPEEEREKYEFDEERLNAMSFLPDN